MKDYETKLESTKIQKESVEAKWKYKIECEKLRHENIMEELKLMAKYKITSFQRGSSDNVGELN